MVSDSRIYSAKHKAFRLGRDELGFSIRKSAQSARSLWECAVFSTVLIANRGEIACRIIRSCRRLGIKTVAVYSDADASALHVKQADIAVHIGASRPADSYLQGERIIQAALQTGAQAIHPGFGFLSENADFADAVEKAGLSFVGPRSSSMRKMGSKAGAKDLMTEAGVPVVPGYSGADQSVALLCTEAARVGFPLMIKAAHGGGGKGMRVVHTAADFEANLESCQREAKNAFGRDRVLLERYILTPRHIEFQIFGDQHGQVFHLNERECSVQRRYQKILEESPSPVMTPALRAAMGAAAIKAGQAIDYVGAGTVEFIVGADGGFYFMEINTRLQVEHPVTEACLGLDLVEWQLRVASGTRLPWLQEQITGKGQGHAIEVRLYAEDPEHNFLPASGKLTHLQFPADARIDSGVSSGDTVSVFYDPMIAKIIVHAPDRPQAVASLQRALQGTSVAGIKCNVDFLEVLIRHPDFLAARIDTGYLDKKLAELYQPASTLPAEVLAVASVVHMLDTRRHAENHSAPLFSPWNVLDGFRVQGSSDQVQAFGFRGERAQAQISTDAAGYIVHVGDRQIALSELHLAGADLSAKFDGLSRRMQLTRLPDGLEIHDLSRRYLLQYQAAVRFVPAQAAKADAVRAPMPGRIVAVKIALGDSVSEGQELLVMEAMKMELSLKAPRAGNVTLLRAQMGDFVEADAVLIKLADVL
jgi:3-methylcrotonyl-CoA carboxylase alpha subunit